jgi:hypothetical protein
MVPIAPDPSSAAMIAATEYLTIRLRRPPFPPDVEAMARVIDWWYDTYVQDKEKKEER